MAKRKRLPNGYGTIKKLSGNRYKPYAAYMPAHWSEKDTRVRECIGYFESYSEAFDALMSWNKHKPDKINWTFSQAFDEWIKDLEQHRNNSCVRAYKGIRHIFEPIKDKKVKDIRSDDFQEIIDEHKAERSSGNLSLIKTVAGGVEKFCMRFDIIDKNYAEFIVLPPAAEKVEREIFTAKHLEILNEAAERDFMASRRILIMIYTGLRVDELLEMEPGAYDTDRQVLIGGKKTAEGRNRTIPVFEGIRTYLEAEKAQNGPGLLSKRTKSGKLVKETYYSFTTHEFSPTLRALNIKKSDGTEFTPHATRHTFASIAKSNNLDSLMLKKIMGHSPTSDITEKTYIHFNEEQLKEQISLLKK